MTITTEQISGAAIRPFTIEIPEAEVEDLRARILATRFPENETVEDDSQGVPLALMQDLARYWTFTSSMLGRSTRTRSRWSSATAGRDRSSSS
jgi:Epoxide hydrolase N terminus